MTTAHDPTFVGRRGELELLAARWARARDGRAQVVVVEGPPGVGKSALVREAVRRIEHPAAVRPRVLTAGGEEAEELVAYGILDQLARSADGAVAPPELRATTEPAAAGAQVLAALGGIRGGCVLVLDDAQWADLPSVQALVFALRRLGRAAVLTVVVTRDGATGDRGRLTRLGDGPDGCRVPLAGLGVPELTDLGEVLGHDRLPRRAAQRLAAHTAGSPLHARALFDEVEPQRLRDPDRPLPCPETYGLLVADRLRRCSAQARALVRAAAVLGERCAPSAAQRLAAPDAALDPATVDEAVAARLLVVERAAAGTILAFPHRLLRAAVAQDLDLADRLDLHARAAALPGDPDQVLGHRVAACLDPDAGLAAALLARADELEGRDETARAAAHLLRAARLHPVAAERERALFRAVEGFVTAGERERAEALRDAVTGAAAAPARDHALALLEFARGRPTLAEELLRRAWDGAGPAQNRLRARVAERLCHLCYLQLRHDEAVTWGVRARELDPGHVAPPLVTSVALAGRDPEEPAGLAVATGRHPEAALSRGAARLWREELSDAHAELTGAVRALRDSGRFQTRLHATGYLVLTELRMGRWPDAATHAAEVVSLATDAEQDWVLARLHSYAAMVHAVRGEPVTAAAHRDAAYAAAAVTGLGLDRLGAAIAAAQVAAAGGEHAEVVRLLGPMADPVRLGRLADPGVSQWPCVLADALVALDRVGEAAAVLEPYERRSAELGRMLAASAGARVRGRIEAGRDRGAASASLRAAIALADQGGGTVEGALARVEFGALLRRGGRRREAADVLGEAAATLARMGAGPAAARCARELDACGLTPAPRGTGGPPRLTPRELAVARLAVDGLSNPQVAAELTVSLNTVEYHLRNVFAKFGISSRAEIAGHLEPSGG